MASVLTTFSGDPLFAEKFTLAFGTTVSSEQFLQTVAALPQIEVRSDAELKGALGAFSAQTQKIYLSESLLKGDLVRLRSVLIEEIGHFVDAQVNTVDSPGDEGAIFATLVLGEGLSAERLAQLKMEDDHGMIIVDVDGVNLAIADPDHTFGSGYDEDYDQFMLSENSTVIFELSNDDNVDAIPILMNGDAPNLVITEATAPTSGTINSYINVSWTVENQGNVATTSNSWYDVVYFSTDEFLDDGDVYLHNQWTEDYDYGNEVYNPYNLPL